ncbi:unnamed protein product [Peronospora destructor]|uniref:Uncharacterized protein n=1 Tax=Peronospora destructor TaxID=86335 RepID=A0AAV0VAR6_9STRA|nr:unnamed protein product [Peronospora destructor]
MIPLIAAAAVGTAGGLLVHQLLFFKMTFVNECSTNIDLYTHLVNLVSVSTDESDTTRQETTTAGSSLTGKETTQASEKMTPVTVENLDSSEKNQGAHGQLNATETDTPELTVTETVSTAPEVTFKFKHCV